MPKQSLAITQFHGGVNSSASRGDIADNELTAATDVMVDELGKIRLIGSNISYSSIPTEISAFTPGYGLMQESYDYSVFTAFNVIPIEGVFADGDIIYGRASGARAKVVQNYQNRLWVMNIKTGLQKPTGTIHYNKMFRTFIYYQKNYDVVASSQIVLSDNNSNGDKWITDQYYYHYETSSTTFDDVYTSTQGVQGANDGALAVYGNGIPNLTQQTYVNNMSGAASWNADNGEDVFEFSNNTSATATGSYNSTTLTFKEVVVTEDHIRGKVNIILKEDIYGVINTPGIFTGIATSGGAGSGLTVDITIGSNSTVTSITPNNPGLGYKKDNIVNLASGAWNQNDSGVSTAKITACGARAEVSSVLTHPSIEKTDAFFIQDNADISIYTSGLASIGRGFMKLGTDTSNVKPVSYSVDGKLRVGDANFENVNNSIKTFFFSQNKKRVDALYNHGVSTTSGSWHVEGSEIQMPGEVSTWSSFEYSSSFTASHGTKDGHIRMIMDDVVPASAGGTGPDGVGWQTAAGTEWFGGITFIYEDGQESDLRKLGSNNFDDNAPTRRMGLMITLKLNSYTGLDGVVPEGVEKIGVYLAKEGAFDYYYQGHIDLKESKAKFLGTGHEGSAQGSAPNYYWHFRDNGTDEFLTSPNLTMTFKDRTGRDVGDSTTIDGFQSAVVANRQVYLGNIKADGIVHGDRIIKSEPNEMDIFSEKRVIEAVINDGDEIIALETYADRILELKRTKVNIINVSQELEFLEETVHFKGIKNKSAVCRTDFGIAWVNEHGCYLYDGKQISNLLEKQGRQIIDESVWATFITDNSSIGYFPKKRQLIVVKDTTSTSDGDMFLYDIVTQSWVTGDSIFSTNAKTNFTYDDEGSLIHLHTTGTPVKWSDTSVAHNRVDIRTKALSFTSPSQRKKIYKIYVSHKSAGVDKIGLYGEIFSQKATSGQGPGELSNDFFIGYLTQDISAGGQADNYITQRFSMPATDLVGSDLSLNNVYSLRLYFLTYKVFGTSPYETGGNINNIAPAGFSINDVSVVYRLKGVN